MLDLHVIASQILQAFRTSNQCVGSLLYTITLLQALRLSAHSCTIAQDAIHNRLHRLQLVRSQNLHMCGTVHRLTCRSRWSVSHCGQLSVITMEAVRALGSALHLPCAADVTRLMGSAPCKLAAVGVLRSQEAEVGPSMRRSLLARGQVEHCRS